MIQYGVKQPAPVEILLEAASSFRAGRFSSISPEELGRAFLKAVQADFENFDESLGGRPSGKAARAALKQLLAAVKHVGGRKKAGRPRSRGLSLVQTFRDCLNIPSLVDRARLVARAEREAGKRNRADRFRSEISAQDVLREYLKAEEPTLKAAELHAEASETWQFAQGLFKRAGGRDARSLRRALGLVSTRTKTRQRHTRRLPLKARKTHPIVKGLDK